MVNTLILARNETDYVSFSFRIELDDVLWLQTKMHDKSASKRGLI